MTPQDARKLLGGYATGTLTPAEQQALFEAALQDQDLFDALAREQSLRDLLREPAARAQLLAAIYDRAQPWWRRINRWTLVGATAAACLAVAAGVYFSRPKPAARPVLVAETQRAAPPVPAPAPAAETAAQAAGGGGGGSAGAPAIRKPPAIRQFTAPQAKPAIVPLDKDAALAPPPAAAAPAPPPVPQPAASATETVPVTAAAPVVDLGASLTDSRNARALFYALPAAGQNQFLGGQAPSPQAQLQPQQAIGALQTGRAAFFAPNLGVKWTALRMAAGGQFSEVDAEQIKTGDVIRLRLVPNDNGYLTVMDGSNPVVRERPVTRMQSIDTPDITGAGKRELTVLLSRQAMPKFVQPVQEPDRPLAKKQQAANVIRPVSTDQLSQTDRSEHAVYEVKTGNNLFAPVTVRITLNFR